MADVAVTFPKNLPPGAVLRAISVISGPKTAKEAIKGLPAGVTLRLVSRETTPEETEIGTMEDKTGRLVLHEAKKPETIQKIATEEHEEAKQAITAALEGIEGAEIYAARDEKDRERLKEKQAEGQSPQTMRDYSGFRIAVESPEAWKQAAAAIRRNFEVPDEQDEFESGSELCFHGHTLQIRLPESEVTHEVQLLPREVAENADEDHSLYEKVRDGDTAAKQELQDLNREHWEAFLVRNGIQEYKFGSTQVDIPEGSEAAEALEAARQKIDEKDLAGKGTETGGNHITVRYGMKSADRKKLRAYLRQQSPFEVVLGATESFPPSEHSDGAAVIMAPVISPDLERMHREIAEQGEFKESDFEYRPHATVAYVKPEAAKKYIGMKETEGVRCLVTAVSITGRDGSAEEVCFTKLGEKGGRGELPELSESGAEILIAVLAPDTENEEGDNEHDLRKTSGADSLPAGGADGNGAIRGRKLGASEVREGTGDRPSRKDLREFVFRRMGAGNSGRNARPVSLSDSQPGRAETSNIDISQIPRADTFSGEVSGLFGNAGGTASRPTAQKTLWGSMGRGQESGTVWRKGDRFVSPDGSGGLDQGRVKYWNPGYNGAKPGGRIDLNGGTRRLESVPAGAMRLQADPGLLQPVTGTPGEEEVLCQVQPVFADFVADYLLRNTKNYESYIVTDAAKLLIPQFAVDPIGADRDICAAACAIHEAALATLLGGPVDPERPEVLIEVGSPGSGKTTGLSFGGVRPGTGIKIEAIPDDADRFCCLLERILASGRKPVVEWVWVADPGETVRRMILRALGEGKRRGIERTVQMHYMAEAWTALPQVLSETKRRLGDRVEMVCVDNSGEFGTQKVYTDFEPMVKAAAKLDPEEVRQEMEDALEDLEKSGWFASAQGQKVYEAACRYEPRLSKPVPPGMENPPALEAKSRLREMTLKRRGTQPEGHAKAAAEMAWKTASERFLSDPKIQVPY